MKYETIKELDEEKCRRLTGVKRSTFNKMVEILRKANKKKKAKGGRKNKLGEEDMLLMVLEYLREYRTYFHISQSYGVSESTAYKTVRWVEDTLVKHPDSGYQGWQKLQKNVVIPYKKYRKNPLTEEQKEHNRKLASFRMRVENKIRELKIFKILSHTYRNFQKKYNMRFNIIAGIVNLRHGF